MPARVIVLLMTVVFMWPSRSAAQVPTPPLRRVSDQVRATLGSPGTIHPTTTMAGKTRTGSALETFLAGAVAGGLLGTATAYFVTCPNSTNRACLGSTIALSALVMAVIALSSRL